MNQLTLVRKAHLSDSLWLFEFACAAPLVWHGGQFIKVGLPHQGADEGGITRRFTIAAAPHEEVVRIVTRIGPSSFKQTLLRLEPGESLQLIDAPAGDFTWRQAEEPHLLLAAGVGITPFYAMLHQRVAAGQSIPARLIYAHATTPLPFQPSFRDWAATHPEFSFQVYPERFTANVIKPLAPNWHTPLVYISGPSLATKLLLPPFNIPAGRIKQDAFSGYAAADY